MKISMILKYLLTAIFAMFFIFAGTGYNVAKYCCHNCQTKGIDHIIEDICSHEITENMSECSTDDHSSDICLNNHETNLNDSCKLVRFTLDQFSIEDADNQIVTPSVDLFGMLNPVNNPTLLKHILSKFLFESPPIYHPFSDGKNINIFKSEYLI